MPHGQLDQRVQFLGQCDITDQTHAPRTTTKAGDGQNVGHLEQGLHPASHSWDPQGRHAQKPKLDNSGCPHFGLYLRGDEPKYPRCNAENRSMVLATAPDASEKPEGSAHEFLAHKGTDEY
jgi:hypothetical protein